MGNYLLYSKQCSGNGECLQRNNHNDYSINEKFSCNKNCHIMQCKNYLVCDTLVPEYILKNHDNLCINCYVVFGKNQGGHGALPQKKIDECLICYENNVWGISNPKCDHFICINCFKKCYHNVFIGLYPDIEPEFPFSRDVYEIYLSNRDNDIWNAYDEIYDWEIEHNEWTNRQNNKIKIERCPFCRK
jgi:hypothetical protein